MVTIGQEVIGYPSLAGTLKSIANRDDAQVTIKPGFVLVAHLTHEELAKIIFDRMMGEAVKGVSEVLGGIFARASDRRSSAR